MKKIFTLIFSLGLLTSAFAQSEHRQPNQKPGNTYQSSPVYSSNHESRDGSNTYSYNKNAEWNKNSSDDHSTYNRNDRDRNDRYENYGTRDQHFEPKYGKDRRDYDDHFKQAKAPLLQVVLGIVFR